MMSSTVDNRIPALVLEASIIVRDAAAALVEQRSAIGRLDSLEEGGREVKLRADQVANDLILGPLRKTGLGILSEESGWSEGEDSSNPLRWVVDPLDGSFNYLRGLSFCAVSVGLCRGDTPVAGIVYDFNDRRLVTGIVGQGACAEGEILRVSQVNDARQAVLTTGFPARMNYDRASLDSFISQIQTFQKIRMMGSAVQSCIQVAMGRFDAYFERDIMIWDIAAGLAIIEAAGGVYDLAPGTRPHAHTCWASNPALLSLNPIGHK